MTGKRRKGEGEGKGKNKDMSTMKVVQTGEETFFRSHDDGDSGGGGGNAKAHAQAQKKGSMGGMKALFYSSGGSSKEGENESTSTSADSLPPPAVRVIQNGQTTTGCQGCVSGDTRGHINHVRGIYDRTGTVPTDEALLGTSPDGGGSCSGTSNVVYLPPVKGGHLKNNKSKVR